MKTNRATSAPLGVVVGVLLLGALIFVSGCSTNSANTITTPAAQQIFVTQGGSVSAFPLTANGNVAPTATLSGNATGLNDAHRLAFDTQFNAYVTNAHGNSVTIYAPGTKGNSAPTATISGGNTGLVYPLGIDLDAQNHIYVANGNGDTVTVYAAGASGNATPTVTIGGADTGLDGPNGLALDSIGDVYVANQFGNTVTIYYGGDVSTGILTTINCEKGPPVQPQAACPQDIPPLLTISGDDTGLDEPHALTVDGSLNLYVTNRDGNSVTIYAGAIFVAFAAPYTVQDLAPTATIVGAKTELNCPNGIAFDASGNFYVTNGTCVGPGSVSVYSAADITAAINAGGANNVAPVATIGGANTGFTDVHGVNVNAISH